MHEEKEQFGRRPGRLRSLGVWLAALAVPAAFVAFLAVWVGGNARKLMTGESAVVRSLTRCVEGGGLTLPSSHCDGSWVFADGHTGIGEITSAKVAVGETIFAGDGWAYSSAAPLHRLVWIPGGVFCAGIVCVLVMWLRYRRSTDQA
ncbi:hypothetical protein [Streptomyces lydicus]|uniref:hypothetical protein n=1 Tax=Streptomyces lydicus TaxID=47763 RepID=UPI000F8E3ADC|nr:hypothetical protein [Streptomyces lydicus]